MWGGQILTHANQSTILSTNVSLKINNEKYEGVARKEPTAPTVNKLWGFYLGIAKRRQSHHLAITFRSY